jgi:hypothetical protein
MTDVITGFDIATDLKVEFFLPDAEGNLFILGISNLGGDDVLAGAGQFIIGVSLLGGTDTLAGAEEIAFTWQGYECSVADLTTTLGGEVQDSLYFQPYPSQAELTVQNLTIDPSTNPAFRAGTPMRVRLEKDAVDKVLYQGYLDTVDVSYDPDGDQHIMTITAFDSFKKLVNTRLSLFDTTDPEEYPDGWATPYEVVEQLADLFGTSMNAASEATEGEIPGATYENFIPNVVLYDAIKVGLGLFWVDPATEEFVLIPRPITLDPTDKYTIGNNHGEDKHLCMSDIEVISDIDAVYNSLQVSLKSDQNTVVTIRNTDSIELYGELAVDTTIDTTDVDELERWGTVVFNQTTTKLVKSVETPAIDRLGNLTHAAVIAPGETINIDYRTNELDITDTYTVTKVSHSIDVNNWFTTLELWKEF